MKRFIILLSLVLMASLLWSKSMVKIKYITITGKVLNSSKKPIRDALITIGEKTVKSNSKGKFSIKTKVMRSYKITVKHNNYESVTVNKNLDEPNKKKFDVGKIILSLKKKYGNIAGKVNDDKGKPVPFANVVVTDLKQGTQTDENGRFRLTKIPVGTYSIVVGQMGYQSSKITGVTISNNETTVINFTLIKSSIEIKGVTVKEYKKDVVKASNTSSSHKIDKLKLVRERRTQAELKDIKSRLKEGDKSARGRGNEVAHIVDGMLLSDPSKKNEVKIKKTGELSEADEDIKVADVSEKPKTTLESDKKSGLPSKFFIADKNIKALGFSEETSYHPVVKPRKSGLKASFVDDNKQFNYFLHFLEKFKKRARHFNLNITDRFIITFTDAKGNTLPDVSVSIFSYNKELLVKGKTYSDGTFMFFPSALSKKYTKFRLIAEYNQSKAKKNLDIQDPHNIIIKITNTSKRIPEQPPLDILFVLDTTGSMGEEIQRLINTIELINMNLMEFSPKPDIRFGMVLFKDKRDNYITKIIPFTKNLSEFTKTLSKVDASGGGDKPEDLQAALYDAVKNVKWRKNGVKAAFVITDAPPHLNYPDEKYTYVNAAKNAKSKGIKIFTIGTGGLDINGEYVLRQISQFTGANYIFLTYGEKGESEGGKPGSVSHHTGENFKTDKLEAIVIQLLKKELKLYTGKEVITDEYIEAKPISDEKTEETLDKLFSMALSQLYDYSSIKIDDNTSTAVSPFMITKESQKATAEYFYQNLELSLAKNKKFKAVERKDLQPVLSELKFQLDDLSDQDNAAKLGKFMGAKLLITAKIFEKGDHYEIFLKLLNVETVEILSITELKINKKLGL